MPGDFVSVLISCIALLIVMAALMAGVDFYYNMVTATRPESVFFMNLIFTLSGGFIMLLVFIVMLVNETVTIKIFRDDTVMTVVGLLFSCVLMYFVKIYLMQKFEVVFKYSNLIVISELASMMIIPYICYRFLEKFGKAFAH